jgi:hypothetical protein
MRNRKKEEPKQRSEKKSRNNDENEQGIFRTIYRKTYI